MSQQEIHAAFRDGWRVEQIRGPARDCGQAALPDALAFELRQRTEQRLGVWMLGVVE